MKTKGKKKKKRTYPSGPEEDRWTRDEVDEGGKAFVTISAASPTVPFIRLVEQIDGAAGHRTGKTVWMRKEALTGKTKKEFGTC